MTKKLYIANDVDITVNNVDYACGDTAEAAARDYLQEIDEDEEVIHVYQLVKVGIYDVKRAHILTLQESVKPNPPAKKSIKSKR